MITLLLGGARSGKSAVAERLVTRRAGEGPVTYLATAHVGDDAELAVRVAAHRDRRPPSWTTVEVEHDLAAAVAAAQGVVLLDSLGPWVARLLDGGGVGDAGDAVVRALRAREADCVLVSEEVGLGVHPSYEAGLRFRDELGTLNQAIAAVAGEVLLVVAGRALRLESI